MGCNAYSESFTILHNSAMLTANLSPFSTILNLNEHADLRLEYCLGLLVTIRAAIAKCVKQK
jgi:hypothetical protein